MERIPPISNEELIKMLERALSDLPRTRLYCKQAVIKALEQRISVYQELLEYRQK